MFSFHTLSKQQGHRLILNKLRSQIQGPVRKTEAIDDHGRYRFSRGYFLLAVGWNATIDDLDDSQIFNHPSNNTQVIQSLNFDGIHRGYL
jgi:hypothetical protein